MASCPRCQTPRPVWDGLAHQWFCLNPGCFWSCSNFSWDVTGDETAPTDPTDPADTTAPPGLDLD